MGEEEEREGKEEEKERGTFFSSSLLSFVVSLSVSPFIFYSFLIRFCIICKSIQSVRFFQGLFKSFEREGESGREGRQKEKTNEIENHNFSVFSRGKETLVVFLYIRGKTKHHFTMRLSSASPLPTTTAMAAIRPRLLNGRVGTGGTSEEQHLLEFLKKEKKNKTNAFSFFSGDSISRRQKKCQRTKGTHHARGFLCFCHTRTRAFLVSQ